MLPVPGRRIDAEVLRSLLSAVRTGTAIQIEYQSMSPENPDPLWRWITPHAFGFDGFRWHVGLSVIGGWILETSLLVDASPLVMANPQLLDLISRLEMAHRV